MQSIEIAYQDGVAEAERDIAAGKPKLRYDARGAWGEDLARMLQTRFGVELKVLSCFVTDESSSFDAGYNATVEARIDATYGAGALAAMRAEVQARRKEAYEAWIAEQRNAESPCAFGD